MKTKSAGVLALLLLLSACGKSEPLLTGEIVSCKNITVTEEASNNIMAECLDGTSGVNIAAIKGPAIINVWGSWCKPCTEELPYFTEFYMSMDKSIQLIGVDVEEKDSVDGRMFARTHGIMWPNLYDRDGSTRAYFGMGVPVTWFIDDEGEIAYKKIGPFGSTEEIRSAAFKYLGVRS